MFPLIDLLTRLFPARTAAVAGPGVAQQLMEQAEARTGHDPRQAQELRAAAFAYLSIVR